MATYQVLDTEGVWHTITGFQCATLRADGVPITSLRVIAE